MPFHAVHPSTEVYIFSITLVMLHLSVRQQLEAYSQGHNNGVASGLTVLEWSSLKSHRTSSEICEDGSSQTHPSQYDGP